MPEPFGPTVQTKRFQLRLFGDAALFSETGETVSGFGPGKSLAVLAFLDLRGKARRDELMSLLWGDMPEEKARNAFRQALHRLRGTLGDSGIIETSRDSVTLHSEAGLVSDRREFEQACDDRRWNDAIAAYRGDFLESLETAEPAFDRWSEAERLKLRTRFENALRSAASESLEAGQLTDAIRHAQRLSESAPFDEQAVILEASVLIAAGRAHEALGALRRFTERLREELDVEAPAEVRSMFARLNRAEPTPPSTAAHRNPPRSLPFIGREPELARLLGATNRLGDEHGSTLLIEGAEGSGKSRLLDAFLQRARTLGRLLVLRGRDRAFSSTLPYASIAEALRPLARAPGIAGASRHLLAEAARLVPELRDQFDLPNVPPVEDDPGRLRFFEGIAAAIDSAAYEQPVCIVLDDFQNASPSTFDLIAYLSGRLRTSPVLILLAYRPDRIAEHVLARIRGVAGDAGASDPRVVLGALTAEEGASLAQSALPRNRTADAAKITDLVRAGSGLPGTIIELARQDEVVAPQQNGVTSIRDVLWTRLQGRSPSERRVFFAVSLLERPASLRLLGAAAHLPESATATAINSLLTADLVREDDGRYTLAHDSTAVFVHDSGGVSVRAMLAGWAADALGQEADSTDEELTRLYALAGRTDVAFVHARRAAFRAASLGAWSEGAALLNLAITFAPTEVDRAAVETLLGAFGRGPLRLEAGDADLDVESEVPDDEEISVAEPVVRSDASIDQNPQPSRHRPFWIARSRGRREWILAIGLSALIIAIGIIADRRIAASRLKGDSIDSLLVAERGARGQSISIVSGRVGDEMDVASTAASWLPAWAQSTPAAWVDPVPSPDGRFVALSHITGHGKDVVVISGDRHDTMTVATGGGDNAALDWSPDSRALLVSRARTLTDGSFHSDLWIYRIGAKDSLPIDTVASRSVVGARWSPNGTRIGWIVQSGANRRSQIFVSAPDGSNARNLSASNGDDYDIAWAPDGSLLEFTSTRTGAPRIFAYDFDNARVWPVTDRDGDGRAMFSPDGRYIVFESTRDRDAAVYLTRPLGGSVRRVTPVGRQFALVQWRGARPSYVDRVRIIGPSALSVGDTAQYSVLSVDQFGGPVSNSSPVWSTKLPPEITGSTGASQSSVVLSASGSGRAQLRATIPGWRSDSLDVVATAAGPIELEENFGALKLERWAPLGSPLPYVAAAPDKSGGAVFPNADLEWDSGILSRGSFDLRYPLTVRARVYAPFGSGATQASATLALVEPVDAATLNKSAPQLSPMVSITWDGRSGALRYAVGSQSFADRGFNEGGAHDVSIAIDAAGAVVFAVDGAPRWTSSLRYLGALATAPSQLWIGGRATGLTVAFSHITATSVTNGNRRR